MSERLDGMLEAAATVKPSTRWWLNQYKVGAATRRFEFTISDEEADALFCAACHYCGYRPENCFNGIDRVENNVGYIPGNVVTCCSWCNRAKGKRPVREFMNWLNWVRLSHADKTRFHDFVMQEVAQVRRYERIPSEDKPAVKGSQQATPKTAGLSPREYVRRKVWGDGSRFLSVSVE